MGLNSRTFRPTPAMQATYDRWIDGEAALWQDHLNGRDELERTIERQWGECLRALELWWLRSKGVCEQFDFDQHKQARAENDRRFRALRHLQIRALRVASEIFAAARTGHAEAAHARWRTLHELAITMAFLADNDEDLSDRYLQHPLARIPGEINRRERLAERLNLDPTPTSVVTETASQRDGLVQQFGEDYANSAYGWAAKHLGKRKPNFADIELAVDQDHARLAFAAASESQHAGPAGLSRSPAADPFNDAPVPGPSTLGVGASLPGLVDGLTDAVRAFVGCRPDATAATALMPLDYLASQALELWTRAAA